MTVLYEDVVMTLCGDFSMEGQVINNRRHDEHKPRK